MRAPAETGFHAAVVYRIRATKVIAEGVETLAQMEFLKRHGCDQYQGFYLSPPLTAAAYEKLLRAEAKATADALDDEAARTHSRLAGIPPDPA